MKAPIVIPCTKCVFDLHFHKWKETDTLIRVKTPMKSLGKGGMRMCYEVEEIAEDGSSTAMVAKVFLRDIRDLVAKDYYQEGEMQCMCEMFAYNFNRIHASADVRKPIISFLQCYVVRARMKEVPSACKTAESGFFSYRLPKTDELMFVMEPKLTGTFTKYNNNFGDVYEKDTACERTRSQLNRRTDAFFAAEAFSHFTLVDSGGTMLVCDLQGVNDFFTDPQIHTDGGLGFGMGNMGRQGIEKWMARHKCNTLCRVLHLPSLEGKLPKSTDSKSKYSYTKLQLMFRRVHPVSSQELLPLPKPLSEMTEDEILEHMLKVSALTD